MKAVVYLVLASLIGSSCSSSMCPFPGIPKHGLGHLADNHEEVLSWDKKQQVFKEGEVIIFNCENNWVIPWHQKKAIKCLSDGTWNGLVPKCEKAIQGSSWETEFFVVRQGTLVSKIADVFLCDDPLQYTKFHLQPKNSQFNVKFITEIRVEMCQGSEGKINMNFKTQQSPNTQPCSMILEQPLMKVFSCNIPNQENSQETLELIEIEVAEHPVHLKDVMVSISTDDYCGLPTFPVNGNTSDTVGANELKFSCNEGFSMVGEETAFCSPSTGQWTAVPSCVRQSDMSRNIGTIVAIVLILLIVIIAIILIALNRKRCCRNRAAKVQWDPNSMESSSPTASAYNSPEADFSQNYPDDGQLPEDMIAEQIEYENEQREYDDVDDRVSSD